MSKIGQENVSKTDLKIEEYFRTFLWKESWITCVDNQKHPGFLPRITSNVKAGVFDDLRTKDSEGPPSVYKMVFSITGSGDSFYQSTGLDCSVSSSKF